MVDYVAKAVASRQVIATPGQNLFAIAAQTLGDATQWNRIAEFNGLTDPWIQAQITLNLPIAGPSNGGVLGL